MITCMACGVYCGTGKAFDFLCPFCSFFKAKVRHLFDVKYSHEQYRADTAQIGWWGGGKHTEFWKQYINEFDAQMEELDNLWSGGNGDSHERA